MNRNRAVRANSKSVPRLGQKRKLTRTRTEALGRYNSNARISSPQPLKDPTTLTSPSNITDMERIFASHLISVSRAGFCSRRSDVSRKSFHPCSTELRALVLELQHARIETPSGEGFPNFHTFSQHLQPPSASVFVLSTCSNSASCLSVWLEVLQLMTFLVVGSTY
jgi:hypothetical protein